MRYWIGALCFVAAVVLQVTALRHRRRVLAIAPREAIERHRARALSDPRSLASMGEIGRSFVLFFVCYAGLKTGLLWFAFHADRYLSLLDLAGFYVALAAYVHSLTLHTRWRRSDALAAAEEIALRDVGSTTDPASSVHPQEGVARVSKASLASAALLAAAVIAPAILVADARAADAAPETVPEASDAAVPAGDYRLDPAHANVTFRVDHLGFTRYVGRFTRFDARLRFDPARPAGSHVEVRIEAASLDADNAPAGFLDTLRGNAWLDAPKHPAITFRSTRVESAGGKRLRITGDFTLHGVTRPVALDATYNGGYAGHPMDPNARIGFSATTKLQRSEFGISTGIPAPGSTMGVGDEVEVLIEAEFTGPPLAVVQS